MSAKEKQANGFSLLELLVVIAIISILATVGIGNWRDIQARTELASVTKQVLNFLYEVQARANWRNHNYAIHFFAKDENNHWCLAVTSEQRPINCDTELRFISPTHSVEMTGVSLLSTLAFYGRRSNAQTGSLRLENQAGQTRIIVSAQGRIRYCSFNSFIAGFNPC